ncbi:hypothetical protein DMENIID0001_017160 [Sergentomyia squamirostris]
MLDEARHGHGKVGGGGNKRKHLRRPENQHRLRVNQIKQSQKETTSRFEKMAPSRYSAPTPEPTSIIPSPAHGVRSLEIRGREVVTAEKRHRHRKPPGSQEEARHRKVLPAHRHGKHHHHHHHVEPEKSLEQYSSDVVRSLHNDAHRHGGSKHNHHRKL